MAKVLLTVLLLISSQIASSIAIATWNPIFNHPSISRGTLDQFIRFTKFAFAAAVVGNCSSPLGTTLVETLNNRETDTQGYIARDDSTKQIIVSFRGTEQIRDVLTDLEIDLVPFSSPGVDNASGAKTHSGFLSAYNSVARDVLQVVASELKRHQDYSLVSTGHSLGGAIASIAGVSLRSNFPSVPLRVFTFGQPRTGDAIYANLADSMIGKENLFRAVHTFDGVPTVVPPILGYRHHGTEYWNYRDPSIVSENIKICSLQEDPTCSDSIPSSGINGPHFVYFGSNVIDVLLDPSTVCW